MNASRAAAAAFLLAGASAAPAADPPLITHTTDRNAYLVHYEVQIRPRDDLRRNASGGVRYNESRFVLDEADIYFPIVEDTASSETKPAQAEAQFWWRGEVWVDTFNLVPPTPGFGRYAHLHFLADPAARRAVRTQLDRRDASDMARLIFKVPVTCLETVFDERRALDIPWPAVYPPALEAWTQPDQHYIHSAHPSVVALVAEWTNNAPRSVPPVLLAKALAAEVIKHVQPSAPNLGHNTRGRVEGLDVQGAAFAAEEGAGSIFDMVCLYVAACRAAGLPTRLVVGIDVEETNKHAYPFFHAWAEFALLDPADNTVEWIPVDIIRQRDFGSRPPRLEHRWEYFGNNRFLDTTVPLAFHFHPPDRAVGAASGGGGAAGAGAGAGGATGGVQGGIVAYGSPALWGWRPDPLYAALDQQLNIMVMGAPQRGGN